MKSLALFVFFFCVVFPGVGFCVTIPEEVRLFFNIIV